MGPPKFISLRPEDSLTEVRRARGISLRELLDELNKLKEKEAHTSVGASKKLEPSYHNLSQEDRLAQDQLKKLRGALNKLAPDNFYIQLLEIQDSVPASNYHLMKIFVQQLIEKAVEEDLYSLLYAHLCNALKNIELLEMEDEDIYNFGGLVLDECYGKFCYGRSNINWFSPDEPNDIEKLELAAKEDRKRKLLVGVVRFLGDLFKAGLLDVKELYKYIKKLEQEENEKCIEALSKLLTTAGKELEAAVFQSEFETDWCNTWERVLELSKRENLPLRQRFLLMNTLDLMNNGWQPRFPPITPKTFAEILIEQKEMDDTQVEEKLSKGMTDMVINNDVISKEPTIIETEKQILHLLKTKEEANYEITKWELENFKGRKTWLIYSLTRAVLRVSIEGNSINKATFLNNLPLLKRYIISRQAEVACMYAVQYIVVAEMKNPKGLLEQICQILYTNGIVSYIAFLDWRENWSKSPVLEIRGKAEAHITLANFFIKLFWESTKPSANYKSIVKELNSFDLEHFVSMSKLPPEIGKRIKMEEEREKAMMSKNNENNSNNFLPIRRL